MCLIKSQGKLIFDPIPKSGKIEKLYKPYWAIISIENDVDKYYRWFLQKEKGLILQAYRGNRQLCRGWKKSR